MITRAWRWFSLWVETLYLCLRYGKDEANKRVVARLRKKKATHELLIALQELKAERLQRSTRKE